MKKKKLVDVFNFNYCTFLRMNLEIRINILDCPDGHRCKIKHETIKHEMFECQKIYINCGDRFSPGEVKDIIKNFGLRKICGSAS